MSTTAAFDIEGKKRMLVSLIPESVNQHIKLFDGFDYGIHHVDRDSTATIGGRRVVAVFRAIHIAGRSWAVVTGPTKTILDARALPATRPIIRAVYSAVGQFRGWDFLHHPVYSYSSVDGGPHVKLCYVLNTKGNPILIGEEGLTHALLAEVQFTVNGTEDRITSYTPYSVTMYYGALVTSLNLS